MQRNDLTDYVTSFENNGYVLMENAITADQLAALNDQLRSWIDESRQHDSNFGEIMDGRPRFDVEPKTIPRRRPRCAVFPRQSRCPTVIWP